MAKPPYLEMGVVVSFSEIFNRPATLEAAREVLSQYKREAVLLENRRESPTRIEKSENAASPRGLENIQ